MAWYTNEVRKEGFLRNIVFGVEDSLVSTVGFVSGIAAASVSRTTLLLSGVVLIAVEAFSMGIGSTLSEESVQDARRHRVSRIGTSVAGGLVMFISYLITGFVVLVPYLVTSTSRALPLSVATALVLLFLLGAVSAKISRRAVVPRAIRMTLIGGIAVAIGIIVGRLMP